MAGDCAGQHGQARRAAIMGRRSVKMVGSGITTRNVPSWEGQQSPEEMVNILREIRATITHSNGHLWAGFDQVFEAIEERLTHIYSAAPDPHSDLPGYNALFKERESEGWYLREISFLRCAVEQSVGDGSVNQAVQRSILIGELLAELRIKHRWEHHAMRGKKIVDSAREGGEARQSLNGVRDETIREEFGHLLNQHWPAAKARRHLAKRYGLTPQRIGQIIKPKT